MTLQPPSADIRLSEMIVARLCHDLGSPLSTLTAVMPQAADPAAHALLSDTVNEIRLRHRLLCAAFGTAEELGWAELPGLLRGAPRAHSVAFAQHGAPAALRPDAARLLLAAALLGAEALPRGGEVRLQAEPDGAFAVLPRGRDAAWPEPLLRLASGGSLEAALREGPRHVLAAWVWRLAADAGMEPGFALPAGAGLPALSLRPAA